jgi:hypothetical protein
VLYDDSRHFVVKDCERARCERARCVCASLQANFREREFLSRVCAHPVLVVAALDAWGDTSRSARGEGEGGRSLPADYLMGNAMGSAGQEWPDKGGRSAPLGPNEAAAPCEAVQVVRGESVPGVITPAQSGGPKVTYIRLDPMQIQLEVQTRNLYNREAKGAGWPP